ncbi:uncharacterized protein MYCFIDRAFT_212461 [Pseudocercospora fijiensis CIRAD86]|uniref:Uncharacterized protein n=1 Tax=Pseudocercospora fijiensis (strain CIRAD86) TaxID=383855 RepID=M3A2U2_PSEFD|nr:uncharacterized protein MYCFIDRAFT_212461 [Pseudocercospora fijiensis CIRAD86]EME78716.1 hypothetical protein MYCFIDRAFT_212461 [Pseudocercospora fijiensis CIRAD86]
MHAASYTAQTPAHRCRDFAYACFLPDELVELFYFFRRPKFSLCDGALGLWRAWATWSTDPKTRTVHFTFSATVRLSKHLGDLFERKTLLPSFNKLRHLALRPVWPGGKRTSRYLVPIGFVSISLRHYGYGTAP